MINIEELLKPISPERPAGEDLAYDKATQELETLLRGKPETQFSTAEEPKWEDVVERTTELLRRSKDLRVSVILTLSLLRTEGLPGFRDGITLLRGFIEQYWDALFPPLDPEDNNDPTERVNILAAMLVPSGPAFDDPMQFHRRLQQAPLCQSPRLGRFGYADLHGGAPAAEGQAKPDTPQIEAAFRDTPAEFLEKVHTAIVESIEAAKALDEFLTKTISGNRAPDWTPLIAVLNDLRKCLIPYLPREITAAGAEAAGEAAPGGASAGQGVAIPGAIRSREDVVQALDRICDFYTKAEPSSPVPLLLRRAQRMAQMNFLEIITELTPDALGQAQLMTGVKPEQS